MLPGALVGFRCLRTFPCRHGLVNNKLSKLSLGRLPLTQAVSSQGYAFFQTI
jgi:hypothetical protein